MGIWSCSRRLTTQRSRSQSPFTRASRTATATRRTRTGLATRGRGSGSGRARKRSSGSAPRISFPPAGPGARAWGGGRAPRGAGGDSTGPEPGVNWSRPLGRAGKRGFGWRQLPRGLGADLPATRIRTRFSRHPARGRFLGSFQALAHCSMVDFLESPACIFFAARLVPAVLLPLCIGGDRLVRLRRRPHVFVTYLCVCLCRASGPKM